MSTVNMDQLVKVINKLQDAFVALSLPNAVDLPQIVVIGSQSSGKSSVLENIVGRDFLPRGQGIVTRRPLILQLIKTGPESGISSPGTRSTDEWGEFTHLPDKKFYNFEDIREEIISETDSRTGGSKSKGVSDVPINLKIFSPNVLTLTLVDLPGLTKVPVGGQPHDIERQIRDMVIKYIRSSKAIILAVTAANTDLANSDGLKLAREVDPEGTRTIGVLTKIDLMDPGTDVVDILAGRVIPLQMGYVAVINRGQKDIEGKKAIQTALENEKKFFENHPAYQAKSAYCGTLFLAKKLNLVLINHIRNTLPEIKRGISSSILKYEMELSSLGDNSDLGQATILSAITEFCDDYRSMLDGSSSEAIATELVGGARIAFVFHEIYANAIKAMDPFDQIKDQDIRTLLYNSTGSSPSLFVAFAGFESLIKGLIKRLDDPSARCISLIYDELSKILLQLLQKPIFKRFPNLREKFHSSVMSGLKKCVDPTIKFISNLILAEIAYINTTHPDFIGGHKANAIIGERLAAAQTQASGTKGQGTISAPPIDTRRSTSISSASTTSSSQIGTPLLTTSVNNNSPISLDSESYFGSFLQKKGPKKPGILEAPPAVLKATGSLSEREYIEIEVIKLLLISYFNIVKRNVMDLVPKAIMLQLVNSSMEEMQRTLLNDLYKMDQSEDLLKEPEHITKRRREVKRMIDALHRAEDIVSSV